MHFLADADDFIKTIFGIGFVVIWIIGAIASAAGKKKKESEQLAAAQRSMPVPVPPPIPVGPAPQSRPQSQPQLWQALSSRLPPAVAPPPIPPKPVRATAGRSTARPLSKKVRPPAIPLPASAVEPQEETHSLLSESAALLSPSARAAASRPPDAAAIRRWLTPQTLRSQFILTELLQPPLALRPTRAPLE